MNNVLQNLLNEFYTYAKSGLIAKKRFNINTMEVTLTKYWTVSLIYLGQYERFWNILCRMISKRAFGLKKFFLYICYRYLLNYVPFLCTENLWNSRRGITKVRITHGSPFDGPTKYYLVPKLKAYLRTHSCFCTYRTSKNHCRYFLHGFYPLPNLGCLASVDNMLFAQ